MTEVKNKDEVLNNLFSKLLPIFNEYFQESSNSIAKQIELKDEIKFACGDVMKNEAIEFANFVGDRPLPEYSKSTNKWRWWDNDERDYAYATTEQLYKLFKTKINKH